MKLSILLITYNQEKYIQECIDGLIIQNMPFEYEIIVADDFSTDNTLNIIKENLDKRKMNYQVLLSYQNLGIYKNYKRAYQACRGEYIAILEGDDYWTSPNRLSNHIAFLDNHRECVLSFNEYISLYEETSKFIYPLVEKSTNDFEYISANDMASGNKIGNLSTCVFRHDILNKMEEKFFDMGFADWFLGLFLGQYGLLAKQKDVSSVYRKHSNGLWSGRVNDNLNQRMLKLIDKYNECLNFKYNDEFTILKKRYNVSINKKNLFSYNNIRPFIPPILILLIKLLTPDIVLKFIRRK